MFSMYQAPDDGEAYAHHPPRWDAGTGANCDSVMGEGFPRPTQVSTGVGCGSGVAGGLGLGLGVPSLVVGVSQDVWDSAEYPCRFDEQTPLSGCGFGSSSSVETVVQSADGSLSHERWGWDRAGLKVLVAEDNELCRKLLVRQLEGLGVEYIHAVDNGLEAMRAVRRENFTHILLDLVLPCIDGEARRRPAGITDPTCKRRTTLR